MTNRGPAPKPTRLRVLEGDRGKKKRNTREPRPKPVPRLTPPSAVSKDRAAGAEWRRITKELGALGMLHTADRATLTAYCLEWSKYLAASNFLRENGSTYVIRDKDGQVKYVAQFPQVNIARAAGDALRKLAAEFGLTPASRTRVEVPTKTEDDEDLEDFRRGATHSKRR